MEATLASGAGGLGGTGGGDADSGDRACCGDLTPDTQKRAYKKREKERKRYGGMFLHGVQHWTAVVVASRYHESFLFYQQRAASTMYEGSNLTDATHRRGYTEIITK